MERIVDRVIWPVISIMLAIMVVFIGIRLVIDVPNVLSGTVPDESEFERRYATHAWLAYAHILPGAVYLAIAPIQLWRGFGNRHIPIHRRLGRVAIVAGITSGIFAILFGFFMSFGGALQAAASVVFGVWFITALVTAYRAIRRRDIRTHRRWMIRAFAVGLAVGTIRLWIGLFEGFQILELRDAFGVAFWISFVLHALVAEAWLFWRPSASGAVRHARASGGSA
jgi:uncharacterized membrane protein